MPNRRIEMNGRFYRVLRETAPKDLGVVMPKGLVIVYEAPDGYRWRLQYKRVLADGGQGYATLDAAEKAVERVFCGLYATVTVEPL